MKNIILLRMDGCSIACHEEIYPERREGSVPDPTGLWVTRMLRPKLSMTTVETGGEKGDRKACGRYARFFRFTSSLWGLNPLCEGVQETSSFF